MTKDAAFISGLKEALRIVDEYDKENEAIHERFKLKRRDAVTIACIRQRIEAFVSDVEALNNSAEKSPHGK